MRLRTPNKTSILAATLERVYFKNTTSEFQSHLYTMYKKNECFSFSLIYENSSKIVTVHLSTWVRVDYSGWDIKKLPALPLYEVYAIRQQCALISSRVSSRVHSDDVYPQCTCRDPSDSLLALVRRLRQHSKRSLWKRVFFFLCP